MKKLLLLPLIALLMSSCLPENTNDTSWDVVTVRVLSSDWDAHTDNNGQNLYYSCTLDMPEISSYIYTNGLVQAYYVMDGAQQLLPYSRHYENVNLNRWTQTVDFDYSVGQMTIYVTNSDFYNEIPPTMDFRVVMLW